MTEQTPLTAESEEFIWECRLVGVLDGAHGSNEPFFRSALAGIEAAAARRAIEGSGVVEAAAAFIQRWDDRTYTDAADMVGHCWESIGALRNALAALHRPVASPDPTCTWCGTPIAEHPLTDACAIAQESEVR